MKIKTGSIETHYELIGEGDCLVLIHGFSDNLAMWYNQIPQFVKKYRVLAYDVRGHGSTEAPDDRISIDILAEDLYELLHGLNIDKAYILRYSMGGRIASTFGIEHPNMIKGLVLANSGIPGSGFSLSENEMKTVEEKESLMKNLLATGDIESISEIISAFSFSPGYKDRGPEIYKKYKDIKLQNTLRHYLPIMEAIKHSFRNPPDLTQIRCPTLLVAGNQDALMDLKVIKSMETIIPNVQLKIFSTGHASALEVPDNFNETVLNFLDSL